MLKKVLQNNKKYYKIILAFIYVVYIYIHYNSGCLDETKQLGFTSTWEFSRVILTLPNLLPHDLNLEPNLWIHLYF